MVALASLHACADPGGSAAVPTLRVDGFEVDTIPTDGAILSLSYYLPEPYVPGDDLRIGVSAALSGPEGIAAFGTTSLDGAPALAPQGEDGQVAGWYLPDPGAPAPQDSLDGETGRVCTFDLVFAVAARGNLSLTLQIFDVDATQDVRATVLDDVQRLALAFDGGDEVATVVE